MRNDGAGEAAMETSARDTILVVESEELSRHRLKAALRKRNRLVYVTASFKEALNALPDLRPDLVMVSLELPEMPGTRAIDVFLQRAGGAPVIAMSKQPEIAGAVEALRHGAVDYLSFQADQSRVQQAANRALEEARSTKALDRVRQAVRDQYGFNQLLTQSPRMLEVFDQIRAVAVTDATVLILGETGTGKELVSRAIHERSRRQERPFISVNCGAFTESLLESELFGHEKGAFTGAVGRREGLFEMADGGTLFLDELGETSLNVQVNLLRVLEDMTFRRVGGRDSVQVNVRIVAATNVHLEEAVADGDFRQDLFFRLSVFPIRLPPLRERREDIPLLMRHFLDEIAEEYQLEPPVVASEAMQAILGYRWPGNVRQLRAMCERWVITRSGQRLEREHLEADISGNTDAGAASGSLHVDESLSMKDNLLIAQQQVEKAYLYKALSRNAGHLGKTADFAGITRRTLYTKMKQYGLDAGDFRGEE